MVISALVLYFLVRFFAEGNEQESRLKILGIAVAVGLVNAAAARNFPLLLQAGIELILVPAAVALALVHWCSIDRKPALKISASFLGIQLALAIGFALVTGSKT